MQTRTRMIVATFALLLVCAPASALEMTSRQVKMGKDLSMSAAQKIAGELFKLDAAGDEPILLMIGTRTGYAPAAMVVVDAIAALRSDVYAVIQSEAFGVGAVVASFCKRRYAFTHASVLFTKLEYDSEKTMKEKPPLPVEAAEQYLDRVYAAVAERLDKNAEKFKELSTKRWYLSADQAKREGVVTEVVKGVKWIDLVVETVEVKKTSTVKRKRPLPDMK